MCGKKCGIKGGNKCGIPRKIGPRLRKEGSRPLRKEGSLHLSEQISPSVQTDSSRVLQEDHGAASAPRSDHHVPPPAATIRAEPREKVVSLFVWNHRRFLPAAAQVPPATVSKWLTAEFTFCMDNVILQKGVVDLISADHVFASFSAVRFVGAHRQAVVRTASNASRMLDAARHWMGNEFGGLARVLITYSACSAQALCGDFGCSSQMRFMAIGGLSSLVAVVERFATRREIPGLVDAAVHADVETNWYCRLRELVIYDKSGNDRPQILWEVLGEAEQRDPGLANEWMYQLANRVPNPWE
eukprot:gene10759-biopygen1289